CWSTWTRTARPPARERPARWPRSRRPAGSPLSYPTSRRGRLITATTTRCWWRGSSARTGRGCSSWPASSTWGPPRATPRCLPPWGMPAPTMPARASPAARRAHIPRPPPADGEAAGSGIAFASGNWQRAVTDRRHPGMAVRRHFEAMVFTYLAEELRTGDIAITGAGEYADWRANLLPWTECEPLLEAFCAEAGLPATAAGVTGRLRHAHLDAAGALDAGYEDNADLVIGEDGVPALKRRRSAGTPQAAEKLAEAVARRLPERSLLSIVARTAYWLGWHHHFG